MAEQKGIGSKLLGLFVEKDGGGAEEGAPVVAGEKSAAELVAELANQTAPGGEAAPPPKLKTDKLTAPSAAGEKVNFDQIFTEGGLDPLELDRVKKAEELLRDLPSDTPHATKKKIVEATLRTIGFEVVKIIQAANNQQRALDFYVKVNNDQTAKALSDAETQIKQFTEKIAALKAEIEKRTSQLSQRTAAAAARKAEVQLVLDFFGQPPPPPAAPKP